MEHNKNRTNEKDTTRIDAFSDGVFAIAITLLVLELIQILHIQTSDGLLKTLLHHWQSFLAFLIGFITILVCWINHHAAFEYIKKVDTNLMWINGFLLFVVTLTPFPTAVLAEYLEKEGGTALAVFGFNYFLISIAADTICTYAYNRNLVEEENREYYYSYKLIYRYAVFYTLIVFFLCFVSIVVPLILYTILFVIFAAPKKFASRLNKIRLARKKNKKRQ
ncbi:MAG TPA: TMEM175 family protein [Chitinophagaceae bacterium]|nr:TMEM175 family protein [Chitinophagaceae bacterium]